jgi:hypothetical protein
MLNLFQHPFSLWDSFALLGLRMTERCHREAESRGDPKKFQGIALSLALLLPSADKRNDDFNLSYLS